MLHVVKENQQFSFTTFHLLLPDGLAHELTGKILSLSFSKMGQIKELYHELITLLRRELHPRKPKIL
jgi:hypothetical protein